MNQIKVVHIANFDLGLKVHLGNYLCYLRDQGYQVSAISPPGHWLTRDTTILDGIFVKILPFPPRVSPRTDFQTMVHLVKYFRRNQFHIVHTHTIKPGLLGRLAAKISKVPVIVHTVHGFYFYEEMPSVEKLFYVYLERLGATCCHSILSQNNQDLETAVQKDICTEGKIHYLGNGIDLSKFDPGRVPFEELKSLRMELGLAPGKPVIGFIGRLVREKGIYEFLGAVRILKSIGLGANYLVVGSPQCEKNNSITPEMLLHEFDLEGDVKFLGYREDISLLLSSMDIIVLPSHGREGIPRVLMESAALGKPVVATRVRGVIEAVVDGVTGILVPVKDTQMLANGIQRLVENPQLANEMGVRAHQRALLEFDERQFFKKTDLEYRRLIKLRLSQELIEVSRNKAEESL